MERFILDTIKQCWFGGFIYSAAIRFSGTSRKGKKIESLLFSAMTVLVSFTLGKTVREPLLTFCIIFIYSVFFRLLKSVSLKNGILFCTSSYLVSQFVLFAGILTSYIAEDLIWKGHNDTRSRLLILVFSSIIGLAVLRWILSRNSFLTSFSKYSALALFGISAVILISRGFYLFLYDLEREDDLIQSYLFFVIMAATVILICWIKNEKEKRIEIRGLQKQLHEEKEVYSTIERIAERLDTKGDITEVTELLHEIISSQSQDSRKRLAENKYFPKTGSHFLDEQVRKMSEQEKENGIDFDIQVLEPVDFVTKQNVIDKMTLTKLIAGLVRNAVRAIHRGNPGPVKNIQLCFGVNEHGYYEIQVYDTGEPFRPDILANLGQEGVTTGGTGYGYPEIFQILSRSQSSIIIEEWQANPMHYTKCISIEFDGLERKVLRTYRLEEVLYQPGRHLFLLEDSFEDEECNKNEECSKDEECNKEDITDSI